MLSQLVGDGVVAMMIGADVAAVDVAGSDGSVVVDGVVVSLLAFAFSFGGTTGAEAALADVIGTSTGGIEDVGGAVRRCRYSGVRCK